jgi:hypothetical protein
LAPALLEGAVMKTQEFYRAQLPKDLKEVWAEAQAEARR